MNMDDDIYDLGAAEVSAYGDIKTPDREIPRPTKSSNDSRRLHGSSIEKHNSQQLALAGAAAEGRLLDLSSRTWQRKQLKPFAPIDLRGFVDNSLRCGVSFCSPHEDSVCTRLSKSWTWATHASKHGSGLPCRLRSTTWGITAGTEPSAPHGERAGEL